MQENPPELTPANPVGESANSVEREALGLPPLRVEPPLLKAPPKPVSKGWWMTVIAFGVLQVVLAIPASSRLDIPQRIGYITGSAVVWPLLIIGLFSIARRFRTARVRMWILLCVWGFSCFGHLGNIGRNAQQRKMASVPPRPAAVATDTASAASAWTASMALPNEPLDAAAKRPASAGTSDFDLSPGSDKRLIKLIEGAQQDRYREIAAAYARACAERPADAGLALERLHFIERFAYSEDQSIEGAEQDREVAYQYLTDRFPQAAGTILYLLERKYGEALETEAKSYANLVPLWSRENQARFALLRAQAAEAKADEVAALKYARESFRLHATVEAGLVLAEKYLDKKLNEECRQVLASPVFATAENWNKKQQLVLLLRLGGDGTQALALYEELKATAAPLVQDAAVAKALAQGGHIAAAREAFGSIAEYEWNRQKVVRLRFEFELAHGDRKQAETAYGRLRDQGFAADPLLRHRLALLRKHPGASWTLRDLPGVLALGLFFGAMAMIPLMVLMPIHYWSLWREKKGKGGGWSQARWGLRAAWLAFGLLFLMQALMMWLLMPEEVAGWFNHEQQAVADESAKVSIFALQWPGWLAMGLCMAYLFGRARAWRLLGAGEWSLRKALGVGLGLMLLLRMCLGAYVLIFPQAVAGEIAAITSQNGRLVLELIDKFGPVGMLACVAVLVPLIEEMLFRGVLLQGLGKHIPFAWANCIQALAFASVHENYLQFPFYFAFGCIAGVITRRSQGLLPALVFHAANNLVACVPLIMAHRAMG